MRIVVIGAGAMGGSYGGLMAQAGHDVRLIDTSAAHVAAIRERGLRIEGALGEHTVAVPAAEAPEEGETADVAIVFTDTNNTRAAAETAARILAPDGFAVTLQNGVGNVETLQEVVGGDRTLGGSSMCSAAALGPGRVALTHLRGTAIGEIDGAERPRADGLIAALGERPPRRLPRKALAEVVEPRCRELLGLVRDRIRRAGFEGVAGGVVLTGGSARMEGLVEMAEEVLEMPARLGLPNSVSGLGDVIRNPVFATAVGLLTLDHEAHGHRAKAEAGGLRGAFGRMRGWIQGVH